ncbi:MAG: hypothetical protein L6Q99_21675 [Planctomycetes bacterium]|nr:hypothetical protein [Planctomycetota bacterium]
MDLYFHVFAVGESLTLTKPSLALASASWLCRTCREPLKNADLRNVQVTARSVRDDLTSVVGSGVCVASRRLIAQLDPADVARDLTIGVVTNLDGKEIKNAVTVSGRRLVVRGDTDVHHRVCADCGRHLYAAQGQRYLFPHPPSGHRLFITDLCGLITTEDAYRKLKSMPLSGVAFERLPVMSSALDGLGDLE